MDEFRAKRDQEWGNTKVPITTCSSSNSSEAEDKKSSKTSQILEESMDLGRKMNSPSRFGSCRETSSVVEDVWHSPARRYYESN